MATERQAVGETRIKKHPDGEDRGAFAYDDDNLADVSPVTRLLLVGLSFSMTKYGDPGIYNHDIWNTMKTDIRAAT